MNQNSIVIGTRGEERILVTPEVAIDFLGLEAARVLSTPHMIMWMEITSRNTLKQFLDENHDTVGTLVNVRHLAAAPLGEAVRFESTVEEVEGSRVRLKVEAWGEKEKIGEGSHERYIVNIPRFAARLASRNSTQG